MRIGLALSSGGAASMAQIGVLEVLQGAGLQFECVAGTSGGAIVGAALGAGGLAGLRDAVSGLSRTRVLSLFDPTWPRMGMLEGRRALDLVRPHLGDRIEELSPRFAAVAADLDTGREVVLREGDVLEAVRASIAVPGLLTPVSRQGRILVDGGLVNPIPITVARALGASFVLAINVLPLAEDVFRDVRRRNGNGFPLAAKLLGRLSALGPSGDPRKEDAEATGLTPGERRGLVDIVSRSGHVAQCQIAALRLQQDAPEFLLTVPVPAVGIFEFQRSAELVEAGREAAERALPGVLAAVEHAEPVHHRIQRWLAAAEDKSRPAS